jgi:hypothetical protein
VRHRNNLREASGKERILSWARAGHVIHQDDWYSYGADGGSPIKAVRSRISELESDEGYGFHHTTRPDGTVEYRLAYVPEPVLPRASEPQLAVVDLVDDVDEVPADQLALELGELEPPAPTRAAA